jgi:hypothetical protein
MRFYSIIFFRPLIFTLLFLNFSCESNSVKDKRVIKVDLSVHNDTEALSRYIYDFQVIPIKGYPDHIIGRISKVIQNRSGYYLLDSQTHCIWQIDQEGAVINNINRYGHGPGEYGSLSDFCLLSSGNLLVLDGKSKKLLELKPDGTLVQSIKLVTIYTRIEELISGYLVAYASRFGSQTSPPYYQLAILDMEGNIIKEFFEYNSPWNLHISMGPELCKFEDGIFSYKQFDYNWYCIDKSLMLDTLALLDFGNRSIDTTNLSNWTTREMFTVFKSTEEGAGNIGVIFPIPGGFFIHSHLPSAWSVCSKTDSELESYESVNYKILGYYQGWPVPVPWSLTNDHLFGIIEPADFYTYMEESPDQKQKLESDTDQKSILDQITLEGNPILFSYSLNANES